MKLTNEIKKRLENECVFSSARSSGPGGQNVNKVNSQVELRFSVTDTEIFSEEEKAKILEKLKNRINSAGELLMTSQESRSQFDNRIIVLQKLFEAIESALRVRRKRIKTNPSLASVKERLEIKKIIAQKKQMRKPPEV